MAYGSRLTRSIYDHSPVVFQNLACSWYGRHHRGQYQGEYFWRCFRELQTNQWKSTGDLRQLQWHRLKEILQHAYEYVPFYRKQWSALGLHPQDIKTPDDFQKLPVLDKETVRQNLDSFVSGAFLRRHLHVAHTSGTTGKQLTLWLSQEAYEREYSFRWHHYSWCGAEMGWRIAYFAGHPVVPIERSRPPFSRHNWAENALIFSSYHLSEVNLPNYVKELRSFQPDIIEGYPSSLYLVASYLNSHGIHDIRPKGVYTTSETLFDFQRDAIASGFGATVFNWYGNTERVGNITECPHGKLHVQHAHAYTELIHDSGKPATGGESECSLVVTGLGNFAFPLIRYQTGDVAIPRVGECTCHRGGELLSCVVGRSEDYVVSPDGRYFGRLDHIFKDTEHVREAQIIQDRPDHVTLRIVPREGYGPKDGPLIVREARARLGNAFHIDLVLVDKIERGSNGKFRFIVSELQSRDRNRACVPIELSANGQSHAAADVRQCS